MIKLNYQRDNLSSVISIPLGDLPGDGTYSAGKHLMHYMVVDITPLEEALDRTLTADEFWTFIGSKEFYGDKTFQV